MFTARDYTLTVSVPAHSVRLMRARERLTQAVAKKAGGFLGMLLSVATLPMTSWFLIETTSSPAPP